MMTPRESRLTRAVKEYDRDLYCKKDGNGVFSIFRKATREEVIQMPFGKLRVYRHLDQFIMALTDSWQPTGQPVEWAIEPIKARLKAMDMATDPYWIQKMEAHNEKIDESMERDRKNNVEAFLKEFRPQFARAFNDVNTSTMDKIDRRRFQDGCIK